MTGTREGALKAAETRREHSSHSSDSKGRNSERDYREMGKKGGEASHSNR